MEETSGEEGKSEEGEEEQQQGGLKTFADDKDDCKMCLVVRMDLGMGKGKHPVHFPSRHHPPMHSLPLPHTLSKPCRRFPSEKAR